MTNPSSDVPAGGTAPGDERSGGIGRRGLIGGLALGGVVLGAGAAGGAVGSRAGGGQRRERLDIEIACLGPTMRNIKPDNVTDDGDFRNAFLVEGLIYPAGTIPGDGFIPVEEGAIGRWFCRGWFINSFARPQPHISSGHDYVFGLMSADEPIPRDTLCSTGIEGRDGRDLAWHRAVLGGTGNYVGATGELTQSMFAENASTFEDGALAPCFRLSFDLFLPG
jgi:hypothetical protein